MPDQEPQTVKIAPPQNLYEAWSLWFQKQGVSAVFLAIMLVGVYRLSPVLVETITNSYERIIKDHKVDLDVRDKQIDRMMTVLETEQKTNREEYQLMAKQHEITKQLLEESRLQTRELRSKK